VRESQTTSRAPEPLAPVPRANLAVRVPAPGPQLSVIVIFHDRTRFLRDAINSVLEQPGGESTELILTGPHLPGSVQDLVDGGRVVFVECGEPSIGAKIARGIERASGEILAFLEDDDRFASSKVQTLHREFDTDPSLGYFQNGFEPIDSAGARYMGPYDKRSLMNRWARLGRQQLRASVVADGLSVLSAIPVSHNLSSISVRRQVVAPFVQLIRDVGYAVDLCIFTVVFTTGSSELVFDPGLLTEIRIHDTLSNPSQPGNLRIVSELSWNGRHRLLDFVESHSRPEVSRVWEGLTAVDDLNHHLRLPQFARRDYARLVLIGSSRWDTFAVRSHWPIVGLSIVAIASPRLGHDAYLALRRIFVAFREPESK
jgi:hypothetical protein